jgi:hypothetical protein
MSRSGIDYLERKRIFLPARHRSQFTAYAARSHYRPVRPLPELICADAPDKRIVTQPEEDRAAYRNDTPCPST